MKTKNNKNSKIKNILDYLLLNLIFFIAEKIKINIFLNLFKIFNIKNKKIKIFLNFINIFQNLIKNTIKNTFKMCFKLIL